MTNLDYTGLIIWLVALAFIALMIWASLYEYRNKQSRTVEEYEKAVRSGEIIPKALFKAGSLELENLFKPSRKAAMEFVEDEKKGRTSPQKKGGKGRLKKRSKVSV